MSTHCNDCPLRQLPGFEPFTEEGLAVTARLKRGELEIEPGMTVLMEGSSSPQLYTVLEGQGLRYKTLPSGARQVIGFVFPGDFVGLQAAVMAEMEHSVEATTDMRLCVFDRADLRRLYRDSPERAFDITWISAEEEVMLGEAVATLGQQPAEGRVAWGLLRLLHRGEVAGMSREGGVPLPYRQQDLADALGLSAVHTNKMLAALRQARIATWRGGWLTVHDRARLADLAGGPAEPRARRPLI